VRVGILGGGIAGLSAGWLLARQGVDVTVFERQSYTGGLARSFTWHGFSCDFAAHRLFCDNESVLQQLLALVPMGRHVRRSQIRLGGKWLHDPVNILELLVRFYPETSAKIIATYLTRPRSGPIDSFDRYVLHRYGSELNELFFKGYTERMFGLSTDQIALEWAIRKVRIAGPLDALRASSKKKFNYFYYPIRGGYGSIANRLADEIADRIKLQTSVIALVSDERGIAGITYVRDGVTYHEQFDHVISTLPLPILGRMLGHEFPLTFQKVEAVYLLVDRPYVSDNHWIYFMDRHSTINRMVEFKNMSSVDCPPNQSVVCAEVTGEHEDVVARVIGDVVRSGLVSPEEIRDTLVVREPFSYPVYDTRYVATVAAARSALSRYPNLHLLGRAAEFEHKEVDDNFASAVELVEKIAGGEKISVSQVPLSATPAESKSAPLVYVVILCLNNVADTVECLESVMKLTGENVRTIVVDNGSTDDTPRIVREQFPTVEVIETGRNLGVPRGYNVGFAAALDAGADYVLMLNNDTVVAPELLKQLLDAAERDPNLGIAMPKVMYHAQPDLIWSAGARYRRFPPAIVFIGRDQGDAAVAEQLRSLEFAPSCGLLISRKAFERAGLFDPGYLFYYDDWDFSERVRTSGLAITLVPSAKMWHKVSRTTRRQSNLFWRTWGESTVRYYRRHGRPALLSVPIHVGYIALRELVKGNGRSLGQFIAGARSGLAKPLGPLPTIADKELFRVG
jgi:GT2 family glycosyltransferase/protoporphyrinogen oxidase